jgi:hypothetical protein
MKNIDNTVLIMKTNRANVAKIAVCVWKDNDSSFTNFKRLSVSPLGVFELIPVTAKEATRPIKAIPRRSRKLKRV